MFQKRFEEGYDLHDPSFVAWLKINHPEAPIAINEFGSSDAASESASVPSTSVLSCRSTDKASSSDVLKFTDALPEPKTPKRKQKEPLTVKQCYHRYISFTRPEGKGSQKN